MKLVLIIVSNEDTNKVANALIKDKFYVTKLASTGGLLLNGNTTLLVGTEDDKVDDVMKIVAEYSKTRKKVVSNTIPNDFGMFASYPLEVQVGGATIFVLSVDQYKKI